MEDQMNAIANVLAYYQRGWIDFIRENGYVVGIWTKHFPDNTSRKTFLSMFCTLKDHESGTGTYRDLGICMLAEKYRINPARRGEGFDVYIA